MQRNRPFAGSCCISPPGDRPGGLFTPARLVERRPRFSRLAIFQFEVSGGEIGMLVGKARPGTNLLSEFTLMIVGAFAAGLPMAVAIIWICS